MQVNDHDDNLNNLPSFSLSDDERASRTSREKKGAHSASKNISGETSSEQLATKKAGVSGKLTVLLLVIIILLAAGGIWQFNDLQQKLQQSQAKVNQLVAQMDQIAGTVTSSGQATSKTTEQISSQMKSVIQSQQKMNKALERVQATSDANKKDIANLRWRNKLDSATQEKDTKQLAALSRQQETQDKQISSLGSQVKNLSANQLSSLTTWQAQQDQLKKQIDTLSSAVKQNNTSAINQKLVHYDSALQAMDSYRLQINRRLLQLENSIRNLQHDGK